MSRHQLIQILNADKNFGIGKKNDLLFRLPLDMKFFRETTRGHYVVMGENTLYSLPGGNPLKKRINIVISQDKTHNHRGVLNVHTIPQLHRLIDAMLAYDDVFVTGGASIYRQLLPYSDKVLLTKVEADGGAEVFYPNLDKDPNFKMVASSEPVLDNDLPIRFCTYENKNPLGFGDEPIAGNKVEMTLYNGPFEAMKNGSKDIEMRLYDAKRKTLEVGDRITFTNKETGEKLERTILALAPFDSFDSIYASFPKERLGYREDEAAAPTDMEAYYGPASSYDCDVLAIVLGK